MFTLFDVLCWRCSSASRSTKRQAAAFDKPVVTTLPSRRTDHEPSAHQITE
jgi:hypothetical protein